MPHHHRCSSALAAVVVLPAVVTLSSVAAPSRSAAQVRAGASGASRPLSVDSTFPALGGRNRSSHVGLNLGGTAGPYPVRHAARGWWPFP